MKSHKVFIRFNNHTWACEQRNITERYKLHSFTCRRLFRVCCLAGKQIQSTAAIYWPRPATRPAECCEAFSQSSTHTHTHTHTHTSSTSRGGLHQNSWMWLCWGDLTYLLNAPNVCLCFNVLVRKGYKKTPQKTGRSIHLVKSTSCSDCKHLQHKPAADPTPTDRRVEA